MTRRKPTGAVSSTADYEAASSSHRTAQYVLELYVAGTTPRSTQAVENLKRICEERLRGRYQLRVVDIYQQPELAKQAHVLAVPLLLKRLPAPLRRIVGDLSNEERVLVGLELAQR